MRGHDKPHLAFFDGLWVAFYKWRVKSSPTAAEAYRRVMEEFYATLEAKPEKGNTGED